MLRSKFLPILGYNVFCGNLSDLDFSKKILINTFSPNSYGLALKDQRFEIALKNSDVLVLDG
ncbi:MAG: WecB/TagA/CpsF family glycosyltransferase, partial [Mucilaginibacter sp.]